MSSLKQLKKITKVVADTADFNAIIPFEVFEATTNPIIIFQAATSPQYKRILQRAVQYGTNAGTSQKEKLINAMDMINVLFGAELLKIGVNKVHIQLDPRLAFNTQESVLRALKIVKLFINSGVSKEHVVIKIPSTWEGIQAAKILENTHKVCCNMTTMFTLTQAAACAEVGVSYLAPFVGRINQWYQENSETTSQHEGVKTLKLIQNYLRKFGYKTKVMGAYFLNAEEIIAVAGCDTSTIPIDLLADLSKTNYVVKDNICEDPKKLQMKKVILSEAEFRWLMNENNMATDLLSEMIRTFSNHYIKLENIVEEMLP